jgi:carotenoid cleavage dioxygenase
VRWTFDMAGTSDTIKRTQLDDLAGEFPRFDERRAGQAYNQGWFAGITRRGVSSVRFDTISHIDLRSGRRTDHLYDAGDSPGEPVFVPRTPEAAEGDGWLVAVVYRGAEDRSDFVVYDAQDVAAGPIATAKVPRRVPFGFHGNWRSA